MQKTIIILLILLVPVLISVWFIAKDDSIITDVLDKSVYSTIYVGNVPISVEVMDTPELRRMGLSKRSALPRGEGMLFSFEYSDLYGIWMKDMNFPIDIIWIDESGSIIDIKSGASPDSFPEIFKPESPSLYILEMTSGFVEIFNISIGDKVTFSKNR
ncbi:hypothetical protein CL631_00030 [bacterium]|nr:hypothetical protein [bacterium]|tara:strand:+ start:1250 stop:1723 length:474 start_codon:yes stop_codon:yes gene_type:complete